MNKKGKYFQYAVTVPLNRQKKNKKIFERITNIKPYIDKNNC